MHPFDQIEAACNDIKIDVKFYNGYNGIGLSQGALLLRGLAQSCNNGPKMRNLISLAGPQQGVYQYPNCDKIKPIICTGVNKLIYSRPTQSLLAPATYWHDIDERRYLSGSTFLTLINNEIELNEGYRNNLKSLQKLVLVKYDQDTSIVPNESAFFGYFDRNKNIVPLLFSNLYKLDLLGLKSMHENGQLVFLTAPGAHLDLDENWFVENILPYLKN
ncbi:palmitoyl-protein thioesterase 1-like [Chironomus tepperi]|uniref:palmitoyl-protein thioesterase 1-like n=1 Tax=Chironomus tepperi TaxID=113505 RepID=UPI00391EE5A9